METITKILDVISKDEELQETLYGSFKWRKTPSVAGELIRDLADSLFEKHGIEIEEYT